MRRLEAVHLYQFSAYSFRVQRKKLQHQYEVNGDEWAKLRCIIPVTVNPLLIAHMNMQMSDNTCVQYHNVV